VKIPDNVALVTACFRAGPGHVKELHANGARVVILDLPSSRGKEIAGEFVTGRLLARRRDLADSVTAALDAAAGLGTLRITVNCAGIGNGIRTVSKQGRSRWTPSPR